MFYKFVIVLIFATYCTTLPAGNEPKVVNSKDDIYIGVVARDPERGHILLEALEGNVLTMFVLSTRTKATYFQSIEICKSVNMSLLRIDSAEKSDLMSDIIKNHTTEGPFWMAGSRRSDGVTWKWEGSDPIMYFNWDTKEPNNAKGDENCIEIYHKDALWDDQRCTEKIYYICENIFMSITSNNKSHRLTVPKNYTNDNVRRIKKGQK